MRDANATAQSRFMLYTFERQPLSDEQEAAQLFRHLNRRRRCLYLRLLRVSVRVQALEGHFRRTSNDGGAR